MGKGEHEPEQREHEWEQGWCEQLGAMEDANSGRHIISYLIQPLFLAYLPGATPPPTPRQRPQDLSHRAPAAHAHLPPVQSGGTIQDRSRALAEGLCAPCYRSAPKGMEHNTEPNAPCTTTNRLIVCSWCESCRAWCTSART